jgi:hypothetical protein
MHIYSRGTGIDCPSTENSCLSNMQCSRCLSSLLLQDGKRSTIWNFFFNTNSGQSPETRYSWKFWKSYQLCVCVCVCGVPETGGEYCRAVLQSSAYATRFSCAWNSVICHSCSFSLGADQLRVKDCRWGSWLCWRNFKIPLKLSTDDSNQFVVSGETVISRFMSKISYTIQWGHARPFLLCWWKFGTAHAGKGKHIPGFN